VGKGVFPGWMTGWGKWVAQGVLIAGGEGDDRWLMGMPGGVPMGDRTCQ